MELKVVGIFLALFSASSLAFPQSPGSASTSRRRAVNPHPVIVLPESNRFGINIGNFDSKAQDPKKWAALNNKKIGWVRYWLPWDKAAPHEPVNEQDYDWATVDQDVTNMKRAGLNIYLNIGGAPSWAIENKPIDRDWWPAYVGLWCMTWTAPYIFRGDLPNGLQDSPWCGQYKPNVDKWTAFLKVAVDRYSNPPFNVKYFGMWNEPNYNIFWHYHDDVFPLTIDEGWPKSPNLSIVREILVPGYRAIKKANPNVTVVGPEVDEMLFLKWVLREEELQGPISDVITFHSYGSNFPDDATYEVQPVLDRLGPVDQSEGYGKIIREFGKGRPVWITETYQGKKDDKLFWETIKERPWIDKVFIFDGYTDNWSPPED